MVINQWEYQGKSLYERGSLVDVLEKYPDVDYLDNLTDLSGTLSGFEAISLSHKISSQKLGDFF